MLMRMNGDERKGGDAVWLMQTTVPDTWWRVRSTVDGVPRLRGMVNMDQRPSNPLFTLWAIGGGRDVRE